MEYSSYKDFDESVNQLVRQRQYSSILKKVQKCVHSARSGKSFEQVFWGLSTTHHGETRIKKCRKYGLGGRQAHRLITQLGNDMCVFLYVGTHDDCDKWLDNNRGFWIGINTKNNYELTPFLKTAVAERPPEVQAYPFLPEERELISTMSPEDKDFLFSRFSYLKSEAIKELTSASSNYEIEHAIDDPGINKEMQIEILNILALLKDKRNSNVVKNQIEYLRGNIVELEQVEESIKKESISRGNDQIIPLVNRPNDDSIFDLMEKGTYKTWMLYMHPDQAYIANKDFDGTARLKGVSGSGKTAVTINRAVNLSKKYKDEKILLLTLNKPLAINIENLIDGFNCHNLEVKSLWSCFQEQIIEFIDENDPNYLQLKHSYGEFTYKREESPEEIWQEFYHNENYNEDAWNTMQNIHQYLLASDIFPKEYIKEEFDYIRSHFSKNDRDKYLDMDRKGRAIGLDGNNRTDLLNGLEKWESKMQAIGNIDYLGLTSRLYDHINEIEPGYRCILVDEEQDFGSLELGIIRKMVKRDKNDLFLAGDTTQRVYTKRHDLDAAGIKIDHNHEIRKNYRNSKEVLEAAYMMLLDKLTGDQEYEDVGDENILEPEYAEYSGDKPYLCEAESFDEELTYGLEYIKGCLEDKPGQYGCLIVAGVHINELTKLHQLLIKTGFRDLQLLNGDASFDDQSRIYLSDLEQSKGFEFDVVVIAGCSKGRIPNPYLPKKENHRDLSRLYVAMTRAKTNLVVSFSDTKSSFLEFTDIGSYFDNLEWKELINDIEANGVAKIESPNSTGYLERYQTQEGHNPSEKRVLSALNARNLLLTRKAVGMMRRRQDRLLKYVTGKKTTTSGPVTDRTWPNLQELCLEPRVIVNRILGGIREGEKLLNEVSWFENTFDISKIDNKVEPTMLGDTQVRHKYTIKNEPSREWRVHTIGKCRFCGRPAYQGDTICSVCSSD